MTYFVDNFTVKVGFFSGSIRSDKLNQQLEDELNRMAEEGYEIISVIPLNTSSSNFEYQIISRADDE